MAAEAERFYSLISKTPGVCGGKACIHGTRVRVMDIVGMHKAGHTVEKIREEFPFLNLAQVYAALSYYYEHLEEIEASFAEDEEWAERYDREKAAYLSRRSAPTR
jgi:uncharacterized protein (DUF433 family)